MQKNYTPESGGLQRLRIFAAALVTVLSLSVTSFFDVDLSAQESPHGIELRSDPIAIPDREPNTAARPFASRHVDAGESIDRILTKLVLDSIPHTYSEEKNWGQQDERWDGIKWRRDGLKISTKRRKKMVNHGIWRKYSTELINPTQEFSVQLKNLHRLENGKTGFDIHFLAHLKIQARESKWVKGVQLYSISARGHTKIRLKVSCELGVTTDFAKFPPDLIFDPVATDAELSVEDFRLDRISKLGGEFSQQVSRAVRKELNKKIDQKESKLVEKINRQLSQKKDKMRLSVSDALKSRFAIQAKPFLPAEIQNALDDSK